MNVRVTVRAGGRASQSWLFSGIRPGGVTCDGRTVRLWPEIREDRTLVQAQRIPLADVAEIELDEEGACL